MERIPLDAAPESEEPEEKGDIEAPRFLRSFFDRFPRKDFRVPGPPLSRLGLALLALILGVLLWRGVEKSLRSVEPGTLGVCVNRFTGTLETLDPGTHFRPPALYQIHPVRISDQLLSEQEGRFQITTREGVLARVAVQARWAVDGRRLVSKWSALPKRVGPELVAPVLIAAFRTAAPRYEVARLVAEKREELASVAAAAARARLAESGILLKEVLIGDIELPPEFEEGRLAMVNEVQSTERLDVTLKRKAKEVEETRLVAEAQKAKQVEEAEALAAQRVIAARAEAEAMKHVLALKEKQIQQKKLEAEAERQSIIERARATADASRVQAQADADRRRQMADAEAYAIRTTSLAEFEGLEREAKLVSAHPLLIPKTFADRLSDRVQVILTPSIGGESFTDEVFKRVAAGQPALADPPPSPRTVQARRNSTTSRSH